MSTVSINFDVADEISSSLATSVNTINSISNKSKSINSSSGLFSSYSTKISGLTSSFHSNVSSVATEMDDLKTKFDSGVELYRSAYNTNKENVESIETVDNTSTDSETIKKSIEELFGYNKARNTQEVKEISKEKLDVIFNNNGAIKNGDTYTFTIDGETYGYNTSNNKLIINGEEVDFQARFYMTEDTNINNVANTITILAGKDAIDNDTGPIDVHEDGRGLFNGVAANSNSLIIIPYGSEYAGSNYATEMPTGVSAATKIGDYLTGKSTSNIHNSIIGYSRGGMIAYETISQNNGLYNTFVPVCTFMKNGSLSNGYDSFKNMEIIFFESDNDNNAEIATYVPNALNSMQTLINNGVPPENIKVYTSNSDMKRGSTNILGADNVHYIDIWNASTDEEKAIKSRWFSHSRGIYLIKDFGLLDYLS